MQRSFRLRIEEDPPMTTKRVLVVDDNAENLYLLRALLQGQGYEVDEAQQGAEALDKARQNPPDLIVSDILMPVMDGFALCRQWMKDPRLRPIPFIFYTATYTDDRDREFALSLGAEQFIVKPMDPDAFMAIVSDLVRRAGNRTADLVPPSPGTPPQAPDGGSGDGDVGFLKQYNETLIRKLETRTEQLKNANLAMEQDITERQRADVQLRNSEARFRDLFQHMKSGVAVYEAKDDGADFVFRDINEAGLRLDAVKREDVVGRPVTEVFPGIGEMGLLDVFRRVWRTGAAERYPVALYADTRISRWYENHVYKLAAGEIVAVYDDLTAQKNAEEALRESQDKFQHMFDRSVVGMSITSLSGGIQVNQAFCDMLGYKPEELQNRTWQDLTHPEDVEATQKLLDQIRSGATDSARFVKRYIHKNGSEIWADVGTFLRRDRKGEPLYFMTVASDITDRKKAEDELARQVEELRRWYDVTLGREGRILELKREVNELLANAGRPARYDSADEGNKP
jgi:PAS domain S-box-containing protein